MLIPVSPMWTVLRIFAALCVRCQLRLGGGRRTEGLLKQQIVDGHTHQEVGAERKTRLSERSNDPSGNRHVQMKFAPCDLLATPTSELTPLSNIPMAGCGRK